MDKLKKIFLNVFYGTLMISNALAMDNNDSDSNVISGVLLKNNKESINNFDKIENIEIDKNSLFISSLVQAPIKPGIYESDDVEWILSLPLNYGEERDCIILDVDEVLITGFVPFYLELSNKYENLYERLFVKNKSMGEKFLCYAYSQLPWSHMDEKFPLLLEKIQSKKIRCIANTALDPIINTQLNLDLPKSRVETLRKFSFDFSKSFEELVEWDFDTLERNHITKHNPLFKEGVIFSSETPKHITTLKLFEKTNFIPGKVIYIDDSRDNVEKIYQAFTSKGIECYSFCYSKKKTKALQSYFGHNVFKEQIEKLEFFLNNLLKGEHIVN